MREDTRKIAELMDRAADLAKQGRLEDSQRLLAVIAKLLTEWAERLLSP